MSVFNKAVVLRYIAEVLNRGNSALTDELVAPGFIGHDPIGPDIHGPQGLKQRYAIYHRAFHDLHCTVEEVVSENDSVVLRWTAYATHLGEIMGIAPTRRQIITTGIMTCHIIDSKIQEAWINWDALGLLQQLGVVLPHL